VPDLPATLTLDLDLTNVFLGGRPHPPPPHPPHPHPPHTHTTGYSLNALVDFPADDPIEVIKHLIIGSEGTLGFVSQATYNTVPGEGGVVLGIWVLCCIYLRVASGLCRGLRWHHLP
jgi:hypothetical protein